MSDHPPVLRIFTSTRFLAFVIFEVMMTYFYAVDSGVTIQDWMEFTKWNFITYAGSEGVKHSASAYKTRNDDA